MPRTLPLCRQGTRCSTASGTWSATRGCRCSCTKTPACAAAPSWSLQPNTAAAVGRRPPHASAVAGCARTSAGRPGRTHTTTSTASRETCRLSSSDGSRGSPRVTAASSRCCRAHKCPCAWCCRRRLRPLHARGRRHAAPPFCPQQPPPRRYHF
eukprot:scaffold30356_cov146-Isochrysis_galbana.AAC.1